MSLMMTRISEESLVSVAVITYNSSKYILDTLESIKDQTYSNIELIISDDCSPDNTLALCRDWVSVNSCRFTRVEIVESKVNTGISANMNRAYSACRGVWIKPIAGDDVLLSDCIQKNWDFVSNSKREIVFSQMEVICDGTAAQDYGEKLFNRYHKKLSLPRREMNLLILCGNFIPAATTFIKKDLWQSCGEFDESIPMMEDWPFWAKLIGMGKNLYYNPVPTVKYRMHGESVSLSEKPSERYLKSVEAAYKYVTSVQWKYNKLLWLYQRTYGTKFTQNPIKAIVKYTLRVINPMTYYMLYISIKTRLSK